MGTGINFRRPDFSLLLWIAASLASAADISRYAPASEGIVFTQIPLARAASRLVVLGKDGSTRVLTPGFESAADAAVSFDGKRILFAARKTAGGSWDIFEMASDGSGVRQITHGMGNCRSPIYQSALFYLNDEHPSYQITFASDAAGERESSGAAKSDLYSVRFDGTGLRRLTYGIASSVGPFQMQDGRILFSGWQAGRMDLFAIHLDGADYAAFSGPQGMRIKHMACATTKGEVVFVESAGESADGAGSLGALALRRNLHSYRAITAAADGFYRTPSPLPDGSVLVSRRAAAGGAYAIYRLDPDSGARTLVFAERSSHSVQAVALAPRAEADGHSSVVEDDQNWSKLYCLSVYENDLKREWLPRDTARRLRVIEGVPRKAGEAPGPPRKRLLGDLELDQDGSFQLQVPPNTPIQLQIEDSDGLALRTSAWIWAKNKENRGCIGCHEDGERTPENIFAAALGHPAADLMLPPERRRTVDFRRDVAPILAEKCSSRTCHGGAVQPNFPAAVAHYVDPGRARTSRLVWAILGRNTARPWDTVAPAALPSKMPPAGSPALTEMERRAIIEWIDLGAAGGQP